MLNRRSFLKVSGVLSAGALLPAIGRGMLPGSMAGYPPPGLQTYTMNFLWNAPGADTQAVLKTISGIGVKELETATGNTDGLYYGHKAKEFAAMVNDLGMKWIGNHAGGLPRARAVPKPGADTAAVHAPRGPQRTNLRDNLQQIVDEAAEGGCSWVVCSSSAESTMDEIKMTAELFARAGEAAKKSRMKFAYHNHQTEFVKIDGVSAYDYILGQTNKEEVYMEVDLAWATQAGMDPVAMFQQYPGRFPLWHVKDLDAVTSRPCPVGKGKVDIRRVFEHAALSGVQHTFIEQDGATNVEDPASSVRWLKENVYH